MGIYGTFCPLTFYVTRCDIESQSDSFYGLFYTSWPGKLLTVRTSFAKILKIFERQPHFSFFFSSSVKIYTVCLYKLLTPNFTLDTMKVFYTLPVWQSLFAYPQCHWQLHKIVSCITHSLLRSIISCVLFTLRLHLGFYTRLFGQSFFAYSHFHWHFIEFVAIYICLLTGKLPSNILGTYDRSFIGFVLYYSDLSHSHSGKFFCFIFYRYF